MTDTHNAMTTDQPAGHPVPEFVAWGDISQTYTHEECGGDMQWDDDFTINHEQYVVHRCNVCGHKVTRYYPVSIVK